MDITKRIIAVAAAFTMLTGAVSCSGNKNEDDEHHNIVSDDIADDANVSADDMPFGATEKIVTPDDSENVPIIICYDDRYISDTEAEMISRYFSALNNNDLTMFSGVVYAPYLSAVLSSSGDYSSTEEYLTAQNQMLTNALGDGFLFDYIFFEDGLFSGDYDFTDYDSIVFADDPTAQITNRKLLTARVEYKNNVDSDSHVTSINVCLYTINGTPYILR